MQTYLAHAKSSGKVWQGGLNACTSQAFRHVEGYPKAVITIIKLRPGEPARVIAEIDENGGRWIFGGRTLSRQQISKLTRGCENGQAI